MDTEHRVVLADARDMDELADDSVELVVTSPPYPMIELWDDQFATFDPAIGDALDAADGREAFEHMHALLDRVWEELARVVVDGGIVCVNVGDATRTLGDRFRTYQNHARIVDAFDQRGFDPLPEILWRKPTNSTAKFMGSGMLAPNAYVTLEHEYVLVFRNGSRRSFDPGCDRRYESAYFWEERNQWFSDVWTDLPGESQTLEHEELRERSAAFPLALPYRLVCMYSVYGDTVLDPFWGTGTTAIAAMVAGRNSIGYECESDFASVWDERVASVPDLATSIVRDRIADHRAFVREHRAAGGSFEYDAAYYDFPVKTSQERRIRFYDVDRVDAITDGYRVAHRPAEE